MYWNMTQQIMSVANSQYLTLEILFKKSRKVSEKIIWTWFSTKKDIRQRKKLKVLIPVEVRRKKEGSLHIWKGYLNCVLPVTVSYRTLGPRLHSVLQTLGLSLDMESMQIVINLLCLGEAKKEIQIPMWTSDLKIKEELTVCKELSKVKDSKDKDSTQKLPDIPTGWAQKSFHLKCNSCLQNQEMGSSWSSSWKLGISTMKFPWVP